MKNMGEERKNGWSEERKGEEEQEKGRLNVEFYYEFVNKRHVILTRNGENNGERVRERQ
jgi:hypothetical protein